MAMTERNTNVRTFKPVWPVLASLSAKQVRYTYDRPADTLFVDFHGKSLPAASIALDRGERDYLFMRVDPKSDAVVGLQIEHFLTYAIYRHPELVAALGIAELVGIDRDELFRMAHVDSARTMARNADELIEDFIRLSA